VFAVLLASTVLMRNEVVIALLIWTVAWIVYELRARRRGQPTAPRRLLAAAGWPILVIAVVTGAVALSARQSDFVDRFNDHAKLSVCQAYALGYQQRHPGFKGNPFTACPDLMQRQFGQPMPSMIDALDANAGAMGAHYLWNARLLPYGLQLMLFDRISAGGQDRDPDYVPVRAGSTLAFAGSVLLVCFVAGGLVLLWRDRRRWWDAWFARRAWGWMALGALSATAILAAIWQRPRPEYLYALSVAILALIGTCAMAYADRWSVLNRARAAIPVAAILLVVLIPPHFSSSYVTPQVGRTGQPQKEMVDRLYPIRTELRGSDVRFLATSAPAGCAYLGGDDPCTPILWKPILPSLRAGAAAAALASRQVDFIYLDESELANPAFREVVREAEAGGWTRAAISQGQDWVLLRRG
jgi:hypothetical protein